MSGMIAFNKDAWEEQMARVYQAGFKAGQASRAPVKWPDENTIKEAAKEWVSALKGDDHIAIRYTIHMAFSKGVEWLKNYMEKGE